MSDVHAQHGYHALRVARIVQETVDTRSFVLDVPAELREVFAYRPGQFCTFRVHIDDDELLRCYSMSSAPETDPDLTVTVKRVPGGAVSNWFHDQVNEGDTLELTRPSGVFCPSDGERTVVAFCGGSGVTPVISIAKSVLATTSRPVHVLYANRDSESVIFDAEFAALVEEYPLQLEVRHHLDSSGGFLIGDDIVSFIGARLDADFYICGPTPFMDLVENTLHELGIDPQQISIERFGAPTAAPVVDDGATAAEATVPEQVTIILKRRTSVVDYRSGDTILDTARRAGLAPPFSCEAGTCATCMALVREGSVRMRVNHALTEQELEEGWVLTCQSLPTSPTLIVEYESF